MKVTTSTRVGNVDITFEVEEANSLEALLGAVGLATPREVCNVCGDVGLAGKRIQGRRAEEYVFIEVVCQCGAKSQLGSYKKGGHYWKDYERYEGDLAGDDRGAPISGPSTRPAQQPGPAPHPEGARQSSGRPTGDPMTPNQEKLLFSLARDAGVPNDQLEEIVRERFGHGISDLLKSEASALIGSLTELRDERRERGDVQSPPTSDGWHFDDNAAGGALPGSGDEPGVTERQLKALEGLRRRQSMEVADLLAFSSDFLKREIGDLRHLSEVEAGELIKAIGAL